MSWYEKTTPSVSVEVCCKFVNRTEVAEDVDNLSYSWPSFIARALYFPTLKIQGIS